MRAQNFSTFQASMSAYATFNDGAPYGFESKLAFFNYDYLLTKFQIFRDGRRYTISAAGSLGFGEVGMRVDREKRKGGMYMISGGFNGSALWSEGIRIGLGALYVPWSDMIVSGYQVVEYNGEEIERATLTKYSQSGGTRFSASISNDYTTNRNGLAVGLSGTWDVIKYTKRQQKQILADATIAPHNEQGYFSGGAVMNSFSFGPYMGYLF